MYHHHHHLALLLENVVQACCATLTLRPSLCRYVKLPTAPSFVFLPLNVAACTCLCDAASLTAMCEEQSEGYLALTAPTVCSTTGKPNCCLASLEWSKTGQCLTSTKGPCTSAAQLPICLLSLQSHSALCRTRHALCDQSVGSLEERALVVAVLGGFRRHSAA